MKNRKRQRLNRKLKEERLNRKDICGVADPTPYEAVNNILKEENVDNEKTICAEIVR